jgi:O-antigen/teichoic acid export membrane protein
VFFKNVILTRAADVSKAITRMGDSLLLITAAKVWVTALSILVVPLYLHYLGLEAFGIIGFFAALQAAMVVFDLGLSATLTKKLAQLQSSEAEIRSARDLMRTAEAIYVVVALVVLLLLVVFSQTLSSHWSLKAIKGEINITTVVFLAASSLAMLWPTALYSAALNGLNQLKALSIALSVSAMFRLGIAVYIASKTSNLTYFFAAQLVGSALQSMWLRQLAWTHLKLRDHRPAFSVRALARSASFTGDMAVIAVFSIALTQGDKLLLSQRLTLADFGVYSLAATAASGLYVLSTPFFSAIFPYFARLIASSDGKSMGFAYRQASELMACGLMPLAAVLVVFPYEVLLVWSGNAAVSLRAAQVLMLLSAGTAINGLLLTPYAYQIALGKTRLSLWMSGFALAVTVPALWFLSAAYGTVGAASVWFAVNVGLLLLWPYCMHLTVLKEHLLWWYGRAVALPVATSLGLTALFAYLLPDALPRAVMLLVFIVVVFVNFFVLLLLLPYARRSIAAYLSSSKIFQ